MQEATGGKHDFRYALQKFRKDCENFATIRKFCNPCENFAMHSFSLS